MARFRILDSRKSTDSGCVEFDVQWLTGTLGPGDCFRVFDTHHPIDIPVLDCVTRPGGATLRCKTTLGWDGQFSPAIVDTDETHSPAAFRDEV